MSKALVIVLILYSLHALTKFAVFFFLGYPIRRKALDRAYAGRASATRTADLFLLGLAVMLAVLLAARGPDYVSFLAGLLIGMTLIQLYFHQFSTPLTKAETPDEPVSPIKLMSYAIQATPSRPWKELLVMVALLIWCLVRIFGSEPVL